MADHALDPSVRRASLLAVVVAGLLFLVKFQAYRLTGSQALFSEAMETVVNVLASAVALYVVYLAAKPADRDHPYGHGKVEYMSAGLEGGLVAFAAFLILLETAQAFYDKTPLHSLGLGTVLLAVTGVVNLALGFYLKNVGKKNQSAALQASGRHVLSDVWTTAGVLVGLVLVNVTQIVWIDRIIAVLMSVHLFKEGFELVRESVGALMDEKQSSVIQALGQVINRNRHEGIIQVHHLRVMRAGRYHHIDAHVVVPEFWSVEKAHDETNRYEKKIFKEYEFSGETHFHIDPCRRRYCQHCDLRDCDIRKEPFLNYRELSHAELVAKDEPSDIKQP